MNALLLELWPLIWIVFKVICIVAPLLLVVAYLTLAERKVIGYIQRRLGPNRVGIRGILQPIADGLKLLFKEWVIPTQSSKFLFIIAPILSLVPALLMWAVAHTISPQQNFLYQNQATILI